MIPRRLLCNLYVLHVIPKYYTGEWPKPVRPVWPAAWLALFSWALRKCLSCPRSALAREAHSKSKYMAHQLLYCRKLFADPFTSLNSITTVFRAETAIQAETSLQGQSFSFVLQVGGVPTWNCDSYSCVLLITIGRINPADNCTEIR